MNALRILFTEDCFRLCENCVNEQWDLEQLPKLVNPLYKKQNHFLQQFDEIIITGGEPLLYPDQLIETILEIRNQSPYSKILLYSAWDGEEDLFMPIFECIDGLTYTIHEKKDVDCFLEIANLYYHRFKDYNLSLRVNIFSDVHLPENEKELYQFWSIRHGKTFLENCPLPKNETFVKMI